MLYISLLLALLAVACLIFVPNTVILLSFVAIMHGFAVYSACHALLHKRDSRAALGWIAIILFMPPVGLPLYWLFGIARIDSQAVRLMEKAAQKVMGGLVDLHGKSLTEKPEGFIDKDEVPHAWHYLVNPGSSTNAARDLAQFSARFGTPLTCASIVLAHCMQRARRKISRLSAFRLSELHAYSRYHFWASCSGTSPYSPLSDSKSQIPLFNFFARPI